MLCLAMATSPLENRRRKRNGKKRQITGRRFGTRGFGTLCEGGPSADVTMREARAKGYYCSVFSFTDGILCELEENYDIEHQFYTMRKVIMHF